MCLIYKIPPFMGVHIVSLYTSTNIYRKGTKTMRTKQQITEADISARNDALSRMRVILDDALETWYCHNREGRRITQISLEIDSYFRRELPQEIKEELEKAGFHVDVDGNEYKIF